MVSIDLWYWNKNEWFLYIHIYKTWVKKAIKIITSDFSVHIRFVLKVNHTLYNNWYVQLHKEWNVFDAFHLGKNACVS